MAKRIRIALIAAAMTLLLAMGAAVVGMNVHAAEATNKNAMSNEPALKKNITKADGVNYNDQDTVTFKVEQVNNAQSTIPNAATVKPYTVTKTLAELAQNNQTLGLADKTKNTGVYTFKVTETAVTKVGDNNVENWTIDQTPYFVTVFVKNDTQKTHTYLVTDSATITKDSDNKDQIGSKKYSNLEFTNTVTKSNGQVTVEKAVEKGDYTPKDTDYNFTVTITDVANAVVDVNNVQVYKNGDTNKASIATPSKDGKVTTISFRLKDGEKAVIEGLPIGAKVQVQETNTKDLNNFQTATATYNNGANIFDNTYKTTENSVAEGNNDYKVTNTYNDTTITGVITQIAPFIAMVAIAGGAVALYLVSRKRREA